MFKLTALFLVTVILCGCYGPFLKFRIPDSYINGELAGEGIAVLSFSRYGTGTPAQTGQIVADKLTDAMFLSGKYRMIDRAVVNHTLRDLKIEEVEYLSAPTIKRLGTLLNARFIILGRLYHKIGRNLYPENDRREMHISIRIIDTESNTISGIVRHSVEYSSDDFLSAVNELSHRLAVTIAGRE